MLAAVRISPRAFHFVVERRFGSAVSHRRAPFATSSAHRPRVVAMAKRLDKHNARQDAVSALGKDLAKR